MTLGLQSESQLTPGLRSDIMSNIDTRIDLAFKDRLEREQFSATSGQRIVEEKEYSYNKTETYTERTNGDDSLSDSHSTTITYRNIRERRFTVAELEKLTPDNDLSIVELGGESRVVNIPFYRTLEEFQALDAGPRLPATPHTVRIGSDWKRGVSGPDHDEERAVKEELRRKSRKAQHGRI